MSVTITRAQRDALYEEVLCDLMAVGDISVCLDRGEVGRARELWRRFEGQLRLLDEIGWGAVEPRERFEIKLPGDVLSRALAPLQERAEHAVGSYISEPPEQLEIARRGLQVLAACRGALAQVAEQPGGERS